MYRCLITQKNMILSGLLVFLAASQIVSAEVAMDGTLGLVGPLAGPHYAIPADLGQQYGGNLFHSFSKFNILSSESATFSGPDSVQNLIGRVTGGASTIDGTIRSTIPGAALYLINPAGMLFGEHAQVDVGGSFYVTTADVLQFGDGGRFDARHPHHSTLSAAPITAFGFLGDAPGRIELDGSFLRLREGQTLALIGGDMTLHNATLYAPSGRIHLAAVGSAGDVLPTATGLEINGVTRLGDLRITRDPTVASPEIDGRPVEDVDASGPGGGAIVIRAGNMQAEGVMLSTDTRGDQPGGGVDIVLTGDLTITRGGQIHSNAFGSGNAGNVTVSANNLLVDGADALVPSDNTADLFVDGAGAPPPPPDDGAGTTPPPPPDDGSDLEPDPQPPAITGINSSAARDSSGGAGGTVNVAVTSDLILVNGGEISSRSGGTGPAGKVIVHAGNLLLDGERSVISSNAAPDSSGAGGVEVTVDDTLTLLNGSQISATSFSAGSAGDVTVYAGRAINILGVSLTLTPEGTVAPSGLFINAKGMGQAGDLTITTSTLSLADGGVIDARSELSSGGNVRVNADHTLLQSGGKISASVYGDPQTEGGDVIINGDTLVILDSPGPADTPPTGITARATQGRGGNIIINTDVFLHNAPSVDDVLNASSEVLGNDGAVEVNSPPIDIAGTLVQTPVSYLDASSQLQRRCGSIAANERHRLTLPGPGALPPEPEGPLPASSRCAAEPVVMAESSNTLPVSLPPQPPVESITGWENR